MAGQATMYKLMIIDRGMRDKGGLTIVKEVSTLIEGDLTIKAMRIKAPQICFYSHDSKEVSAFQDADKTSVD